MSNHLYLLDTSIWVLVLRRQPPGQLAQRVQALVEGNAAAVNQIVRLEVLAGCKTPREYSDLDDKLKGLAGLEIGQGTWDRAASLAFDLRRRGTTPSVPDVIIAASAVENDAVLVHADSDFGLIAANSDLRVESFAPSQSG